MEKRTFYRCALCGNLVEMIHDSGQNPVCCGQPMNKLEANTSDGAGEKHVPAVTRNGKEVSVQVGSVIHPMEEAHYIQMILVAQGADTYRVNLNPGQEPAAKFTLNADAPVTVYEFCNLHGLWSVDA